MSTTHNATDIPRMPIPDASELRQDVHDALTTRTPEGHDGEQRDELPPLEAHPLTTTRPRARSNASGSRVSIDHFDPQGMGALRRTMSQASQNGPPGSPLLPIARPTSDVSDTTLTPGDGPFDFEKTLRHVIQRKEKEEIVSRELGVVFTDLNVVGLGASATFQETFASFLNPLNILKGIQTKRHPPTRNILSGFNGVVRPGQMLRSSASLGCRPRHAHVPLQLSSAALAVAARRSSRRLPTSAASTTPCTAT
jgi:ATP-binding cassette subfamily G (WHITE) protein 2 (SNQ2)